MSGIKNTEKEDYITTSVYVPGSLRAEIRRLAKELNTTASQLWVEVAILGLEKFREAK